VDVLDVLSTPLRRMSVCPHDTARNVYGWFFLNSYLQSRLGCRLRFEPQDNFLTERHSVLTDDYDLVYANPYSAVLFTRARGFLPVARPIGVHDETYLVSRPDWTPPPPDHHVTIASATDQLIVHALGAGLLPTLGLNDSQITYHFTGNHAAAAKAVIDGVSDLGYVFNETWHGLSPYTRSHLQIQQQTDQAIAFHCFLVGPHFHDRANDVTTILTAMTTDPDATEILHELNFPHGLEPTTPTDLDALSTLVPPSGA
jgi:phosphonate transport system substrate-binding protein